jgi:tetratricopeptide (TPR) repeat protein
VIRERISYFGVSIFSGQFHIEIWHDRDISAGTDWEQRIQSHLNEAQIILLLVSPDFMVSDYCYGIEMRRALERHDLGEARVIPIILRHVYWQGVLGKLQALPTDARPVKSWPDLDEALYNVTEGIRKVIQEITPKSPPPSPILSTQPASQMPLPTNPPNTSQKTKKQWLEEGDRFGDLKQYSEALAAYEQAIRLDPNDASAYTNKGIALRNLKRYEEALAAYEQAIRLDPNYAFAYTNKSYILNKLKRYREALGACEESLQLDPKNANAYDTKGAILNGLKRYEEALTACEQALRLDPDLAEAYDTKGHALYGLNRKAEAQQAYEKARQLGYSG